MSDIRKIDFTCPECGNKGLFSHRVEIINHPIFDEIDIEDELHMSDITYDKDYLEDSNIVSVICSNCGFEVVPEGGNEDPAYQLIDWLDERKMLTVVKEYRCKFCKMGIFGEPQQYHQGDPVCNECWDERLRATS
jgi:predicted RNA-binding Zn-ribbon protein involved in translation (DUF1610 family)